jgi:hypothetical protein
MKNRIKKILMSGLVPLIEGSPGGGKTETVRCIAKEFDWKFVPVICSVLEPIDFSGIPSIINGKAEFLPYSFLQEIYTCKKDTLFLFDDIGQASISVQAAIMQIIHGGILNGKVVSKFAKFCLASNRASDRAGVNRLITPIRGRVISLAFEVTAESWLEWAYTDGIHEMVLGFVNFRPDCIHDFVNIKSPEQPFCSARSLEFLSHLEKSDGELPVEIINGTVGERFGIEYFQFRKIYKSLFDIKEIYKDPKKTPVPNDLSVQYAVVSKLVYEVSDKNIDQILIYSQRLKPELCVTLIKQCHKKDSKLVVSSKEFPKWASIHSEIIF